MARQIFSFIIFLITFNALSAETMEPQCYSRWDYEYKTMRELSRLEDEDGKLNDALDKLKDEIVLMSKTVADLNIRVTPKSTYTRLGRTECPSAASLIYKGYSAGKRYNHSGGGSNTVCLPEHPTWRKFEDGPADCCRGHIYGTEIHIKEPSNIFSHPVHAHDLPCAVCLAPFETTLMIPAQVDCPTGWIKQYNGYLMAGYHGHSGPQRHVCVDIEPEQVPNGGNYAAEHVLYLLEAQCGSLPCPPYVQGRELACVVCSI